MRVWHPDAGALDLLERGGPFEQRAFRDAAVASLAGVRDLSFGAVTADGTSAAIALAGTRLTAESFPPSVYGGVRSTRALTKAECNAFLAAARRAAGVPRLVLRWPVLADEDRAVDGRRSGSASVVFLDPEVPPSERYSRLARRSIKRAVAAGCVSREGSVADFLSLYSRASQNWSMQYPRELISAAAEAGIACCDIAYQDGEPAAGLFTVKGDGHWMCWLAAQTSSGRAAAASYLTYDALLERAWRANVKAVSFGSSAPGSGGAQFKHYLGAVEVPIFERFEALPGAVTASRVYTSAAFHARRLAGIG